MQIREMPWRAVEKRREEEDERTEERKKGERKYSIAGWRGNGIAGGGAGRAGQESRAGSARERNPRGSLITRHGLVIPSGSHVHRL